MNCCSFVFFLLLCGYSLAPSVVLGHFSDPHSCITVYLSWQLCGAGLIALLYADINTAQKHSWNNSCSPPPLPTATTSFTPPLLIVSYQLYLLNMKTGLLQGGQGRSHRMQRSWLAPDKRPQLPNETASSLSSCYRWMAVLTDRRNKLAGISRRDKLTFQGFSFFLSALVLSVSRCIFIQMQREDERDR